ncbi:hypothetical protein V2605_03235 [Tenacibaculum maritimum]|uniref:DUF7281 domain-containing protein n=1 Tax=Tenacibaculum maritimum TaxID=107401 RepID=UPI0012E5A9C6|nr:hypothetical protein [Tenacibaculum maritimum]CAA0224424.1 conserved hypothetical protein [Tenacibaculum maritimum]
MQLSLKTAKILLQLINGESIANSSAKGKLIDNLVSENILERKGKHRKTISLSNKKSFELYIANQLQIDNLNDYVAALENDTTSRAEFVQITTDSKHSKERAFKGFLINCYEPIKAKLNGEDIIINPQKGSFIFIFDYETFRVSENVTLVGIENSKNFSEIESQRYLFNEITPLFISRYPQNQNKDFIKWMQSVSNKYMHFGDFDYAGIGIYLNEYKRYLNEKASFFVPKTIEQDLILKGNRQRYNKQNVNFNVEEINELEILKLLKLINNTKKGLDQEYYINVSST